MAAPVRLIFSERSQYFFNKFASSSSAFTLVKQFHRSTSVCESKEFDESILDTIACPLSKTPLRYDEATSELVNDELGVAYKITNGIPNLLPHDARMIKQDKDTIVQKTNNDEDVLK